MDDRIVMACFDVTPAGDITHVVLYETAGGKLTGLVGSHEVDPFSPLSDLVRWLSQVLRRPHPLRPG